MSDRTELSTDVQELNIDYMADSIEDDDSFEGLEEFVIPPVLKKMESNSKPKDLVEQFGAGCVILDGQNTCVWKMGDPPFKFVPILFVPLIRKWRDRKDTQKPKVIERTFDKHSELAKIARNPSKRSSESYGNDGYYYQYVEHLTFVGILYDGICAGTQCILSFEKSGHWKGKGFITAIQSRKIKIRDRIERQPMWSQVWGITLIDQHNQHGDWHGFNFSPVTPSVIGQEYVEHFRELNKDLKEKQAKEHIVYEDESTANDLIDPEEDGKETPF